MGFPLVRRRVSARLDWLIWFRRDNKRIFDTVEGKFDVSEYKSYASAATAAVLERCKMVVTDEILCAVSVNSCLVRHR